MKTKDFWIAGALALLIGSAGVAQARDFGGAPGPRGPNLERMFEQADANGDGRVTQEEMDALAEARFAEADADNDGLLSVAEIEAFAEVQRQTRIAERRAARAEGMVGYLDTNGDGLLSFEEMAERGPGARFERLLDRLDGDDDGAISADELAEARDRAQARREFGGRGGWGRD